MSTDGLPLPLPQSDSVPHNTGTSVVISRRILQKQTNELMGGRTRSSFEALLLLQFDGQYCKNSVNDKNIDRYGRNIIS